ncbi:MAG: hypothetical protein WKF87_04410 [Chryseolinea sp.]
MKRIANSLVVLLVAMFSCDPSPPFKSGQLQVIFQYSENYSSYSKNLIAGSDGYYLLLNESYLPFANTILKLDKSFNVLWKVSAEHTHFEKMLELPNGKLIALAERALMAVESDGASWSWVSSIGGEWIDALVADTILYIYGVDENWRPFISGYDFDLNLLWKHNTLYSRILAYDGRSEIAGVSSMGDSLRTYSLDGNLLKQVAVKPALRTFVTDFQVDAMGNRYIYGISYMGECCCNDKISLTKVSATGTVQWQRMLGTSGVNNVASKILIDVGNVYISGGYGEKDSCIGEGHDGNPLDAYLGNFDLEGNMDRQYIRANMLYADVLGSIISDDGEIFVAGSSEAGPGEESTRATIFRVVN